MTLKYFAYFVDEKKNHSIESVRLKIKLILIKNKL